MLSTANQLQPTEKRIMETKRQVCLVRFSPCGKHLFATGYDALVHRWDFTADEPRELPPLQGHHGWAGAIAFSPDGQAFFTADSWGKLIAWQFGEEPAPKWSHEQAHDGWVRALAVSSDGKTVVTAGRDKIVRTWSADDGQLKWELSGHTEEIFCLAIHPHNNSIVSADVLGHVKHWEVGSSNLARECTLASMHLYERIQDVAGVRALQFDPEGESLLAAGAEPTRTGNMLGTPTLCQLDWKTFNPAKTWHLGKDNDGYIFDLAAHSSGCWLIATSGAPGKGQFLLLRAEDPAPFFTYAKMFNYHSIALHPSEQTAVVAATNRRSQGNGAVLDKEGNYLGNWSPLHVFDLAKTKDEPAS